MANCHVLEADQKPTDRPSKRIKRSGGHSLVNRGLAYWLKENVLLIMRAHPISQMHANSNMAGCSYTPNSGRSETGPKPQSIRSGILRWEPPKNKRPLKSHPWQNMNPIADQRSHPAY